MKALHEAQRNARDPSGAPARQAKLLRRENRELREQLDKLAALVDHYFAAWQDAHLMLERRERELAELRRAAGPHVVSMRR